MSEADLLLLRFLLASGGCLAAGLAVWAVTALCRRCLPGIALQRSVWLLAQGTIAAAFLLILLPHNERLRLVPPIELDVATGAHAAADRARASAPAAGTGPDAAASAETANGPMPAAPSWPLRGAQAWLLVYLSGLAYGLTQLWRARRTLNGLAAAGGRLSALDGHAGFLAVATAPPEVIEVDAPIAPMLTGLFSPRLLLPLHLRSFAAVQQQMIVAHELTHLRRRDLHWMGAGVLLQTLFWFNPFMRLLRAQLSWAQELGCDRAVLSGRPPAHRKAYAAALVAQLALQRVPVATALAFGGVSASTLAGRILLIREPGAARRRPWTRLAAIGALAAVLAASVAFQPALAWRTDAVADTAASPAAPQPPGLAWSLGQDASVAASCTEMADAASGRRLVHDGQCDARVTPASTFNIAVSLMGYDSGVLEDEHTPVLPYRKGYPAWIPDWRAATDPARWIRYSVLWFAQQVTGRLGAARFQGYVDSFQYGNQDVSGDPGRNNGLSRSWLSSSLKISPVEQVAFLRKMVNRQLPLSDKAYDMTTRIMTAEVLENGWTIHGKTGTALASLANGNDDASRHYGWYVGWASKGQRTIVFARMVLDSQREGAAGLRTKEAFLRGLEHQLDAM